MGEDRLEKTGDDYLVVLRVNVLSTVNWIDTGLDVEEGEQIQFRATGRICLQRGNPIAYCGPDGKNLKTIQQPLKDSNIGALIGQVIFLVSVEVDEETGEEIRNEMKESFYIGKKNKVFMPIKGRLFLGINENLVKDNVGEFEVEIRLNYK